MGKFLYLNESMWNEFVDYFHERKNRNKSLENNYDYMTEEKVKLIFDQMIKKKLKINEVGKVTDTDGFISEFCEPEVLSQNELVEWLFHEVYCKAEWACRGIKEGWFEKTVEQHFSKGIVNKLKEVS